MTFLGTNMLVGWAFLIFALAEDDEGYTKKSRPTDNRLRYNTRRLVFVIVDIIIMRIFLISCSCHDKTQPMTQSVCTRPT
jgi:hypothetical protein